MNIQSTQPTQPVTIQDQVKQLQQRVQELESQKNGTPNTQTSSDELKTTGLSKGLVPGLKGAGLGALAAGAGTAAYLKLSPAANLFSGIVGGPLMTMGLASGAVAGAVTANTTDNKLAGTAIGAGVGIAVGTLVGAISTGSLIDGLTTGIIFGGPSGALGGLAGSFLADKK